MDLPLANKDVAYCSNVKCSQRKECFRNLDNYFYNKEDNFWFMDFASECCNKGYRKDK